MNSLRQVELLLTIVAASTITLTSSTPVTSKDTTIGRNPERNEEKNDVRSEKIIGTCLTIAPNLLPCNFDVEATWRSRSGEISYSDTETGSEYNKEYQDDVSEEKEEKIITSDIKDDEKNGSSVSTKKQKEEEEEEEVNDVQKFDLAITIVYYLEGCLPARLPFDLPSCSSSTNDLKTVRMNKIVPFKLPGYQWVEDPQAFIFPDIEYVKQIEFSHRQSRASSSSSSSSPSSSSTPSKPAAHSHEPGDLLLLRGLMKKSKTLDNNNNNKGEDVKKSAKGIQDFNKMIVNSNIKQRTEGTTAGRKYVSISSGHSAARFTSIFSTGSSSLSAATEE